MRTGIAALILAYVLSQFYRAFLAVLASVLKADLGVTAAELASASGWWFLAFAAMQVPIGVWLDKVGPRLTTGALLAVAAGGAAVTVQRNVTGRFSPAAAGSVMMPSSVSNPPKSTGAVAPGRGGGALRR